MRTAGVRVRRQMSFSCSRVRGSILDMRPVYASTRYDVGLAQIDAGLARWYRQYASEQHPRDRAESCPTCAKAIAGITTPKASALHQCTAVSNALPDAWHVADSP